MLGPNLLLHITPSEFYGRAVDQMGDVRLAPRPGVQIMRKLDPSIGLSAQQIGTIKYNIKERISRELPELPDAVETALFFQGRTPWIYSWNLLNNNLPIEENEVVVIEATAKLKREFHRFSAIKRYTFLCKVKVTEDVYHPQVSISKVV